MKMKNLLLDILVFFVAINAAFLLGALVLGHAFTFSFIFSVVTPVICALAKAEVDSKKAAAPAAV